MPERLWEGQRGLKGFQAERAEGEGTAFQSTETGSQENGAISTPPLNIKDNTKQGPAFQDLNQ